MLSLRDAETRFSKGIRGGADADDLIVADWLNPAQRMAIYRHHYKATLREALALTFPVVLRLVGDCFFNALTDAFTVAHPPTQPCIAEHGRTFADFIDGFEAAKSLPYLGDVAQLEWLIAEAAQTSGFEGKAFHSRYPIGRIWQTNQPDYTGDATVDGSEGGGWFVIEKIDGTVQWHMLDLPEEAMKERDTQ